MRRKSWKKYSALLYLSVVDIIARALSWIDGNQFMIIILTIAGLFFIMQGAGDFAEIKFKVGIDGIEMNTEGKDNGKDKNPD